MKKKFRDPEDDDGVDLDIDEVEEVKTPWWEDEGAVKDAIAGAVMWGVLRAGFIIGAISALFWLISRL